jgi:acetolactate synthase-1/2/3 large subunit
MTNPDFVKLPNAMGVHALWRTRAQDLGRKMKVFLEYDNSKPALLECVVEKNEHVFPMVRLGVSHHGYLADGAFRFWRVKRYTSMLSFTSFDFIK